MDRNITSVGLALAFIFLAGFIHGRLATPTGPGEDVHNNNERLKRAHDDDKEQPQIFVSDNPYNRPSNWNLDMYRLLAIVLFLAFAVIMYFVVWRFCSGPPA